MPVAERALAALGPKMLELARDRTRGAHPYLANPDHTRMAREVLGNGPLLDARAARRARERPLGRTRPRTAHFTIYLTLPNYVNNLKRIGFTDADLNDGGSDRLVDGVVGVG